MSTSETLPSLAANRALPRAIVEKQNRRIQRISLPLPVRVEVKCDEITQLNDISTFGAGFPLIRPFKRGSIGLMTLAH